MSRSDLLRRVQELESNQGTPIVTYTAGWIEQMNEVPTYAPPGKEPPKGAENETRYDAPPPPTVDGKPDPAFVFVPKQNGLGNRLGWTQRDDLKENPAIENFVVFGTQELEVDR
jgi:hypothetical protein